MKRMAQLNLFLVPLFLLIAFSVYVAQTRTRPADRPAANDFKVTYRTTMNTGAGQNQTSESTTMIKGARQRSENHTGYGYDTIDILQCDLKRSILLSDSSKKYVITNLDNSDSTSTPTPEPATTPVGGPTKRGGTVTYVTTSTDTGERKEMFGFTARHVKSTTQIESSPDACNSVNQKTEVDGWYIDLNVGLDCQTGRPPAMPNRPNASGCVDQTRFRKLGTGKLGFPLIETMTMYMGNGTSFTSTKEVVDLSRQPLDAALFDIPAGYTEAASSQELFGMPSMSQMMAQAQGQTQSTQSASSMQSANASEETKNNGVMVGIAQFNNKAGKPVSLDVLRGRLMGQLQNEGIDAVLLNGTSQMEADAEAKAKGCAFVVYTDITSLKSSKIGGMFGRVSGMGGDAGKTEAKLDFKVFAVGQSSPILQSSTSAKEEGDEPSASSAVDNEARMVSGAVKKRH